MTRRPHIHRLLGWLASCSLVAGLLTIVLVAPASPVFANSITAPSTRSATINSWVNVGGSGTLAISGMTGNVQATVTGTSGFVRFSSSPSGLSAPTGYTTAQWTSGTATEISFFGSQTDVNNALNTLQFYATARSPQPKVSIVAFQLGSGTIAYWSANGHFYEVVDNVSSISWEAARCKAKWASRTYGSGSSTVANDQCTVGSGDRRKLNNLSGYLVNITSLDEHNFLREKTLQTGWIGGTDTDVEGTFKWMDGPEAGQSFWNTSSTRRTNNTIDGRSMFNYFSDGEPNDSGGAEDFAEFGFGSSGVGSSWNDCQNGCSRRYYIIEYGLDGEVATGANGSVTMVLPPAAPTGVSATAGSSSATVSWSAVTDTGGASITSYTATSSPGGFTCTTSSTSCSVSGLTPGTGYTFTVTATNGTHTSSSSTASSSVTPYTLPGAPTGITATPGVGSATLSFTAGSTGFTTITNYKYSFNGTTFTALSPADGTSPITITGLTNNTSYTVTLRAVNAAGDSPSSSTVTFRVDSTLPTVTATSQAVNSAGSITARSDETGTLYLVNQTVTVSNVSSITSAADNLWNSSAVGTANADVTISASGLANGTYKVYAVDDNGNLSAASTATMTIDSTPPSVSIAVSPSSVASATAQTSTVTFTVNESITTFTAEDVTATFGTLTNFSGSGTTYTATFTPSRSTGGSAVITVAAGSITDAAGNSNSTATASINVTATNGRTTYTSGGTTYVVERFLSGTTNWTVPNGISDLDFLVVGGGGGGGSRHAGGGGAGGLRSSVVGTGGGASPESQLSVTPGESLSMTVGAGGAGHTAGTWGLGTSGSSSTIKRGSSTLIESSGGGASDTSGGSGGGAYSTASSPGGSGTSGQGFAGGNGQSESGGSYPHQWAGGGGGGAGGAGADAVRIVNAGYGGGEYSVGGNGGAGVLNSITGTATCYAAGGGGGQSSTAGGSGTTGGGCGSTSIGGASTKGQAATAGTANTGSGGGGGGFDGNATNYNGGAGGSGIIVVRYALPSISSPDLDVASDTGTSSTDNKTSDSTPTFNGSAPVGSTVQLYANGVATGNVCYANDTSGVWQCTTATLTAGTYAITATATTRLESGNETSTSSSLSVTVNTFTVTYDSQGGSAVDALTWNPGSSITLPNPTRPGYTFNGWSTTASGSTKVYETTNPTRNSGSIVYSPGYGIGASDQAATLSNAGTPFDRVRYRMEVEYNGVLRFADVSFDKWSGATISSLSIPDFSSVANQRVIKTNVNNLSVDSNWPGYANVASSVQTGTGKSGRIEIWPWDYSATVGGVSPVGNGSVFDEDDTSNNNSNYGSFQVHNLTDSQTVLAWNNHSVAAPDIGFGDYQASSNTDWTFAGLTNFDKSTWKLQIFIGDLKAGGTSYTPSNTDDFTLYAQWTQNEYSVTYAGNGNTGGSVPSDSTAYTYGDTATVLGNTGAMTRSGYTFSGWCTTQPALGSACSGTSHASGSTFTVTENTTLYAVWLDVTPPSVSSFTSATSGLTKNPSASYTVTFSEAVTGISASDFSNTGTATNCTFNPGTDTSGTTRTVMVSGCSDGTIVPRFAANGATDAWSNTGPTADSVSSTSITLDTTAPTVVSFTSANATPSAVASFTYTVTFSEAVTGVAGTDFSNAGTATGCSFNPGTDTSSTTRTVTVSSCSNGTITPRFAANGASDAAGNAGPTALADATTTITRDATVPVISGAAVNAAGTQITLTYGETLSSSTAGTSAFTVKNAGIPNPVKTVAASGSTVVLTLTETIYRAQTVTLDYVDPAGDTVSTIQDLAGNDATSLTNYSVTNSLTTADVPRAARLLGLNTETVVTLANVSGGIRGITSDGTYIYFRLSTDYTRIYRVPISSIDTSGRTATATASSWAMLNSAGTGSGTAGTFEQTSLAYTSGCIFVLSADSDSALQCIDTSTQRVSSVAVPAGKSLPGGRSWLVGSLISFPDGRLGKVGAPTLVSGTYVSTLRLYTVNGTGNSATLTWSEDILLHDTEDFPNDDHGIATDGKYIYRLNHTNTNYKVWRLQSGSPSNIIFNGAGTGTCAGSGTFCSIKPDAIVNATFIGYDASSNRYIVGDYGANKFYVTESQAPGAGPGTGAVTVDSFTTSQTSPTNDTTLDYSIGFSEDVTGVDGSDFSNSGTATCTFSVTSISAASYTATADCTTDGTIRPVFAVNGATSASSPSVSGPKFASASGTTLTLETVAPTITAFSSSTANGAYKASQTIAIIATVSESVRSGGTLTATLNSGGSVALTAASTGNTLSGTYTIQAGETTADLTVTEFTAGTVLDIAGNAIIDFAVPTGSNNIGDTKALVVDTTPPSVTSFTSAQSSPTVTTSITYTITFSEAVTGVAAGDFVNTGSSTGCVFSPGTDSSSTTRTVTITSCSAGTVIPRFLANGALDAATNAGPTTNADATTTITRDTTAPTITSFSSTTADGFYKTGSTIDIVATASEAIRSGNSINVVLNAGTGANLTLTAASAGTTLTGTYTVAAGQTSADLTVSSFTIVSVQDTAGNAMASVILPTGTNNIGGAKAIVVDTTSPTTPTAVDLTTSSDTGTSTTNNVTGDNTPNINLATLEATATVVVTATKGSDSVTCQFVASGTTGNCDLPTLSDGTWSITATQTDRAGNVSASATVLSVIVDTTVPAAPTNLVAAAGSAAVTISFDAGVGGPAPVTNYKYSLNGGSFTALSPANTTSPITISGLTNDTAYTIVLRTVTDLGESADSASVTATPSRIFNLGNVSYTEQASAVDLVPNVSFAGGSSYDGKYIDFAITGGKTAESLGYRTVSTATTTSGVVSIVGTSVYLGNGTSADPIGSIDATRNGQNGQPLRINFVNSFSNASFEEATLTGWTKLEQQIVLGSTTIAGFVSNDPRNYSAKPCANDYDDGVWTGSAVTWATRSVTVTTAEASAGSRSLLLEMNATSTTSGGWVLHGPAVYSDDFEASTNDLISFDWKAIGGGDDYSVVGYILNTSTGAQTTVLDAYELRDGTKTAWTTASVRIPATGTYKFVFVAGSHNADCGRQGDAKLYIDNVQVFGSKVNDEVAGKVARLVTYANSSDAPDTSRTVTLSTNPTGGSVSKTFNIAITAVDDAPSLTATSTSYTNAESTSETFTAKSGTLGGSDPDGDVLTYSLPAGTAGNATFGAVTYDQYVTGTYGTLWLESPTGRYYHAPNNAVINARLTNDQESFAIRTTASGVNADSTFTLSIAITAAAPAAPTGLSVEPGVRAANLSWTAPTWIGGSPVTGYKIDHSTNGSTWTTFSDNFSTTTSIRVTGLADNTAYYFRVAAKNANGTSAVASTSPTTYSTFNIPTALSLTPVGGTVVANTINSTTTNLTASVNIVAGRVAGGTATLYLAGTAIATDTSISSSDTLVEFDLGASTNAALRAIVGSGGAMTVKIVDAFGLESLSSTAVTLSTDYVVPTVTGVSVSSNPGADKTYVAGNAITFSVATSEAVTVSGTPTLPFLIGSATRTAAYTSGSGTSTLTFSYTVASGDDDSDGISVPSDSLTIGGGIRDAAGNLTTITHDAVAASSNHLVDTTTPTVASVAIVSDPGTDRRYKANDAIDVRVTMSEIVTVSGSPKISLVVGSSTKSANYASGSGSTELLFRYTVASGDTDSDGISISANSLTVAGASITDIGGNISTLTHAALTDDSDHLVDTTAPTVTLSAAGATSTSTALTFTVSSSEQLDCDTITSADFTITLGLLAAVESGWDTSCSLTVTSSLTTGEKAATVVAKASSGFGIADIAGNFQSTTLAGTGASTYVDLGAGAAPAYPAASVTSASVTALLNEPTDIGSGWDISDPADVDWSLVRATVTTDRGTLSAAAGDSGATVSTSSNTVTIIGSMEQVEAALNATGTGYVRVTHTTTSSATLSVKIEPNTTFESGARTYAFNPTNGRYYTLDTTVRSWADSSLAARSMSFAGAGGYLTAVGTQSEDTFVRQTVLSGANGSFFTSGLRCASATAGKVCTGVSGTTSGALYWSPGANAPDAESGAVSPSWNPWHSGEPNQLTTSANVPYLTYWNNGSTWGWDDFTAATPLGAIVEFGNNASYSPITLTRSVTFVIGTADRVDLRRSAVGTASGVVFSTQPAVHVTDRVGNTVVTDNSSIVVASVGAGATLVGTTTATAVNGVATFTNLGISGTAGTVYTVTFTVDQLLVDTQDIQVSHGPAAKLRVATQPVGATAGAVLSTTPVVEVLDATNNLVLDSSASVAVTSSGGQLGGVQTVNAASGVALFPGLTFAGTANQAYTLSFSSGQLTGTTSSTFSVEVGAPTNLVVRTQANGAKYGMAFESQPALEIRDAGANLVTTSSLPVTLTVSNGTTVGTATVNADNGVATFADAGVRSSPGTYTLTYSSGPLATAQQSITVVRAPRTISFSTTSFAKTYGDDTFTVSATASLGTTDGAVSYTATGIACSVGSSTGIVTITGAGSCSIEATAAQGTNYLAATTTTNVSVSVARTPLVITASSHNLTYGDPTPTITPGYVGFVYGETATALLTPPTCSTPYTPTSTALIDLSSTCTGATSDNYDISYTAGVVTVAKQPTSVNFGQSSLSQVFTGDPRAVVTSTTPSDKKLVMRYVGPQHDSATPPVNAGTYTVTATVEETNFVGTATTTLVITPAQQATITLVNPAETTYGTSLQLVATGGNGSGALSYRVASGSCTLTVSGLLSAPGSGTCSVTASRAASSNYVAATSASQTITVAKAPQTLAFTSAVPASPAPDTTYSPSATASSGLAASISISAGENTACSMSNGVVTFIGNGTCEITASQGGNANYAAASSVKQTIEVGRLNQTISFTQPAPVTLGDPAFMLEASASSGLAVAYAVTAGSNVCTVTPTGTVNILAPGTCAVTVSQNGDAIYAPASPVTKSVVVRAGLPGIPHLMAVGAGDSKLTVTFSAPPTDGGSPILAYVVTATDQAGNAYTKADCDTVSFACTIEGLVNGTTYTTTVAAVTAAGTGSTSRVSDPLAPFIAPQAPREITGSRSDSTLDVSWDEPESLGGGTLSHYEVSIRPQDGSFGNPVQVPPSSSRASVISTRSTPRRFNHVFRNLRNGVTYDIRIATITNLASSAQQSNTAQAVALPMITPDPVRDLRIESTDGTTAVATWATPLRDGGSPLTRYTVTTNNGTCTLSTPLATTCGISGLTSGTSLSVTVRAVTTLGVSDPETATLSLPDKPSAPTLTEVTRRGTVADVTWTPPTATGGRAVTSYRAVAVSTLDPSDVQRCSTAGTTCTIRNLTSTSAYSFTVRAINSVGTSAPSASITVGGTSSIPSAWGTPSFGAASARRVLALPPGPQAVKVRAAGTRNRTNVTAVAPPTNVAISHAIITVAGAKGRIIARIKVAVDQADPTASVTIPYASSKVRIAVQFANDYGISKLSAKAFLMPKWVTNRTDAAANVVPGKPGAEVQAKRMGKSVFFAGASAQLDAADKAELRRIAAQIKREGGLVWVTGWARRSPTTSNAFIAKVSEQRAIAVAHYLATLGIQQWIRFNGAGAPTATTGTETDRRVDVAVSPLG